MTDFPWSEHRPSDFPESFKFKTPGDTITGRIQEVKTTTFGGRREPVPELVIDTDDGERSVAATQVMLLGALADERPQAGDLISITYTGDSASAKAGFNPTKQFNVTVERASA